MKSKIAQLRKQRRISQEELANAVGVTRQTITSLEAEKYTACGEYRIFSLRAADAAVCRGSAQGGREAERKAGALLKIGI